MTFLCMSKSLKIIFPSSEFMICSTLYKFIESRADQKLVTWEDVENRKEGFHDILAEGNKFGIFSLSELF